MRSLKLLVAGLLIAVLLSPCAMAAEFSLTDLTYEAAEQGASISLQTVSGEYYLFLPSSADLTALPLQFEGEPATLTVDSQSLTITGGQPFDLAALFAEPPADGVYAVTLARESQQISVKIMVSAHIGSMYITSADPVNAGRAWVEQNKSNKAKGQMTLLRADGSVVYSGELTQIKGRGNSTWSAPKKPYQIKLGKKTDLLETGDSNEAAKTWVLLANYYDDAFIRNSLTYDLAEEFGIAYSPHSRPVDLYYDGEYRGTYLLSEKTEVGTGRVEVHDLEKDIENANPQVADFDDLPTAKATNAYGNEFQYVTGLNDPADLSGGYLLEMDFYYRAAEEKSYFTTSGGYYIVSKSPEYLSQNAMDYISSFYQEFEDAVYNGGINPTTGKSYTDYVDLESLVKCYLILELSQDPDAYKSSTFFYKPAGEDKLYAGPVWDFDLAYNNYFDADYDITVLLAGSMPFGRKLLAIPSFCQAVQEVYDNELSPLITGVALNTDPEAQSGRLRSIASYSAEAAASQRMNRVLWAVNGNYTDAVDTLWDFLYRRDQLMHDLLEKLELRWFLDVLPSDWYFSAVEYVAEKGLFAGTSLLYFSPHETMTRAMAVSVLYRLAGKPSVSDSVSFADVPQNTWYTKSVAWAAQNGIVSGYDDGLFRPNKEITRQELVSILYRYARSIDVDVTAPALPERFTDRNSVAGWAADAFAWAVDRNIIYGVTSTRCDPTGSAERCMAAAIFQRYCNKVASD